MAWEVLFFKTTSGRCPATKFLKSLSKEARGKCSKYIAMLEKHGFMLPSSYLEKVRGDMWALRPEYGGNEYRLFFFDAGQERFVITHAILKNTRKIDANDINTSIARMKDWLQRAATEDYQ